MKPFIFVALALLGLSAFPPSQAYSDTPMSLTVLTPRASFAVPKVRMGWTSSPVSARMGVIFTSSWSITNFAKVRDPQS